MGLMLETASGAAVRRGRPALRLARQGAGGAPRRVLDEAGPPVGVPFTTGILIGIGETRRERIEALLAIRDICTSATATSRK